ncbi:ankyrin repeat domain-containing protein [Undibacterium sp.]|uniref:ankyrin repeat domain-containing protein n=1 Tax=Undibacterium sp. TaxID=1914977 RepID=UPI002BF3C490|nr:ankyrin repeat domain-containing protein [Undibacterium sp.]HTD03717.1 ankyrin repeat domain-containing protein [Undibacterium sp.]
MHQNYRSSIRTLAYRIRITLAVVVALLSCSMMHSAFAGAYDDFLVALKFDDISVMRSLLKRGMDPNTIENVRGETGMMIALRENSMKVFDALLAAPGINIEAKSKNGDTALMLASFMGNLDAVNKLIAADAEINRPGWTALHYAAAKGDPAIIAVLLENYAYIDAASPNHTTPLMMAVRSGKTPAVKLLLDEGADITLKNDVGMTALDFAVDLELKEISGMLRSALKQHGK